MALLTRIEKILERFLRRPHCLYSFTLFFWKWPESKRWSSSVRGAYGQGCGLNYGRSTAPPTPSTFNHSSLLLCALLFVSHKPFLFDWSGRREEESIKQLNWREWRWNGVKGETCSGAVKGVGGISSDRDNEEREAPTPWCPSSQRTMIVHVNNLGFSCEYSPTILNWYGWGSMPAAYTWSVYGCWQLAVILHQ